MKSASTNFLLLPWHYSIFLHWRYNFCDLNLVWKCLWKCLWKCGTSKTNAANMHISKNTGKYNILHPHCVSDAVCADYKPSSTIHQIWFHCTLQPKNFDILANISKFFASTNRSSYRAMSFRLIPLPALGFHG